MKLSNFFKRKPKLVPVIELPPEIVPELPPDVVELKWGDDDKEEQVIDCHVYVNGIFKHTVKVGYLTQAQADYACGITKQVQEELS